MRDAFLRFCDRVYSVCIWVSGIAIVVMSLIIPWGIFTRYVLGTGSQWPEPIAILLMVVFTFLGAAVSYRAGAHIAVAMVTDRLPPDDGREQLSRVRDLLRDARLEQLLTDHRQFAGQSALQGPTGFIRNATYDASER